MRLHQVVAPYLPVWFYLGWWNLGCWGVKLGFGRGIVYGDVDCSGRLYVRVSGARFRSRLRHPFKWRRER